MSRQNHLTKNFTKRKEIFAEFFSIFLFHGSYTVDPNRLRELDPGENAVIRNRSIDRIRDVYKEGIIRYDDDFLYVLLGIENQTDVSHVMPVRNMLYDALSYQQQIDASPAGSLHGPEFLSHFPKGGKLKPVITLVVCWSLNPWDGPRSLHDMIDPRFLERFPGLVDDYRLHLVTIPEMPEEVITNMTDEMRMVFQLLKAAQDPAHLRSVLQDSIYRKVPRQTAEMLNSLTSMKIPVGKGATVDMCRGMELLLEEQGQKMMAEGMQIGRQKGRQEGMQIGRQEGRKEGMQELTEQYVRSMYALLRSEAQDRDSKAAMQRIADLLLLPLSTVEEILSDELSSRV